MFAILGTILSADAAEFGGVRIDIFSTCRTYSSAMKKLFNVYQDQTGAFYYLISIARNRFVEGGFKSDEEAAWQCDRAKWFLIANDLMGRKTAYNYPERIAAETESAWSVPVKGLWEFMEQCRNENGEVPRMKPDEAARLEEARAIAEGQLEREREIAEAKRSLVQEHAVKNTNSARETLQAIISSLKQCSEDFEKLHLPKNTKPANALHNATRAMGAELAALN